MIDSNKARLSDIKTIKKVYLKQLQLQANTDNDHSEIEKVSKFFAAIGMRLHQHVKKQGYTANHFSGIKIFLFYLKVLYFPIDLCLFLGGRRCKK